MADDFLHDIYPTDYVERVKLAVPFPAPVPPTTVAHNGRLQVHKRKVNKAFCGGFRELNQMHQQRPRTD